MDMKRQDETGDELDRALIARVVKALAAKDAATRTKSGLAKRAGNMARSTLNRALDGQTVLPVTLLSLDEALLVEEGTLEAVGRRDVAYLRDLDIPPKLRQVIDRELNRDTAPASKPTRNRKTG